MSQRRRRAPCAPCTAAASRPSRPLSFFIPLPALPPQLKPLGDAYEYGKCQRLHVDSVWPANVRAATAVHAAVPRRSPPPAARCQPTMRAPLLRRGHLQGATIASVLAGVVTRTYTCGQEDYTSVVSCCLLPCFHAPPRTCGVDLGAVCGPGHMPFSQHPPSSLFCSLADDLL